MSFNGNGYDKVIRKAFNPDQERDEHGRWTASGDGAVGQAFPAKSDAHAAARAAINEGKPTFVYRAGDARKFGTAKVPASVPDDHYITVTSRSDKEKAGDKYFSDVFMGRKQKT